MDTQVVKTNETVIKDIYHFPPNFINDNFINIIEHNLRNNMRSVGMIILFYVLHCCCIKLTNHHLVNFFYGINFS